MTNWFVINLLNCGNLDVEKIEELYEKLPECYDEQFIKYVRNSLFWHTNVDIIGLFFQFVYREVAEILEDRDIQIEEYVFGTFSNYLDTKYICNEDYKEEFVELIEKNHLNDFEIIELFLNLL
jgi:hypothetical protein